MPPPEPGEKPSGERQVRFTLATETPAKRTDQAAAHTLGQAAQAITHAAGVLHVNARVRVVPTTPAAQTSEEIELKLEQTLSRLRNTEESLATERQKLKALQQQVLLEGAERAGSTRRFKVTVSLAVIGGIFISIGTPMAVVQIFQLGGTQADYGYSTSSSTLGCAIFLAATTPADNRLVRFMAGFFAQVVAVYAVVSIVMFTMWMTDTLSPYSKTTCGLIYIGALCIVPALTCAGLAWASTLRLLPGSERVPLSRVWKLTSAKMGRFPAAAFMAALPLSAWAILQPEESFVASPRVSLRRIWRYYRLGNLTWGVIYAGVAIAGFALGERDRVLASVATFSVVSLSIAAFPNDARRGRVHEWLGNLGRKDRADAAAVIAAVVGGMPANEVLQLAEGRFSGIPFDSLKFEDFAHSDLAGKEARDADLRARTRRRKLGQVDAFLSHSWHDPAAPKWDALSAWASRYAAKNSHSPYLWLDKACIDQTNISQSLACLPVFLAGCKDMLVVAGPTYTQRLWCIMEIFTVSRSQPLWTLAPCDS